MLLLALQKPCNYKEKCCSKQILAESLCSHRTLVRSLPCLVSQSQSQCSCWHLADVTLMFLFTISGDGMVKWHFLAGEEPPRSMKLFLATRILQRRDVFSHFPKNVFRRKTGIFGPKIFFCFMSIDLFRSMII